MSVARPADQRLAVGDRRKDERAMADGLIARESQFATQVRCGGDAVCHALTLRRARASRTRIVVERRDQRMDGAQLTRESLEHRDR